MVYVRAIARPRSKTAKIVTASLISGSLLMSVPAGAVARSDFGSTQLGAENIVAIIGDAAPDADVRDVVAAHGGDLHARADRADVRIPTSSGGDVVVTPDQGAPITFGLPTEVPLANASVADDGTVVFETQAPVDLAVQATDKGVRAQTIITDKSAPTEYTYTFDGLTPVLQANGSVVLQVPSEGGAIVEAGRIEAPWAVDANGDAVPTRYRVEGSSVVQEVDHEEATYPVVADPYLTLGWYIYINYTAADVKRYWSGTVFLNQAAAAAACAAISNQYGAAACGALSAGYFQSIGDTFASAKARGRGVQLGLTYVGFVPVQWKVV